MNRICEYCGQPIEGTFITTLDGQACKRCYLVRHPYRQAKDFDEALAAGDDPVLLRYVLSITIPPALKERVVDTYNKMLLARYKHALAGFRRVYPVAPPSWENTFNGDNREWYLRDDCAAAVRLMPGIDHFIWNGRVYSLEERGYRDSGFLASDFPELRQK